MEVQSPKQFLPPSAAEPIAATCALPDCLTCRRLRRAAVDVAALNGVGAATDAAIAEYAGITTEVMAEHYVSRERCLVAAYDEAADILESACARAFDGPRGEGGSDETGERLQAAVAAGMQTLATWPRAARFCVLEAERADLPELREHRLAARERFVAMLAERVGVREGEGPGALQLEVLAGGAHRLLCAELERGDGDLSPLRPRISRLLAALQR